MRLYFAYGANINKNNMKTRCPNAVFIGKAVIKDKRFILNQFGVATVIDAPGSTVYGVLWNLSVKDEENLDIFEGVDYGLYYKDLISAEIESDRKENVLIYRATNEVESKKAKLSNYLNQILLWGKFHLFPKAYIDEIKGFSES